MGAGSDNEPLASPGNFFSGRQRRVAELLAELLGRSFLPFPYFAGVNHHIMRVALSLDLDLAKFDQSCFHVSMFCWLELQGKRQGFRMVSWSKHLTVSAADSRRRNPFERSVKCGVEFCFFLVRGCLCGTGKIFA